MNCASFVSVWISLFNLLCTLWNENYFTFSFVEIFFSSTKLFKFLIIWNIFFHISSIEPTDLRALPWILPRACSRCSHNIPSLNGKGGKLKNYTGKQVQKNIYAKNKWERKCSMRKYNKIIDSKSQKGIEKLFAKICKHCVMFW